MSERDFHIFFLKKVENLWLNIDSVQTFFIIEILMMIESTDKS